MCDMEITKTYTIPAKFYWDHTYRDLPEFGHSELLREIGKNRVEVSLDEHAYRDLRSDAAYYSDAGIARDMGMPGLAASARATVKALDEQGVPS